MFTKRKQKCSKRQERQGFCRTPSRSFSETLPFFTYIYYLSTFISHLIIYIFRLDILFIQVSQAQKLKELKELSLPTVAEELRQQSFWRSF